MNTKIAIDKLQLSFGPNIVLKDITINIYKNSITGFMGPSGSGKSTLISVINKMIEFEDNVTIREEYPSMVRTFFKIQMILFISEGV